MESYLRKYQKYNIQCKDFIKYGKVLYKKNKDKLGNTFLIDDNYLKNLYYQILKKLYNLTLENLYEYSNKLDNEENFCRNIVIKQLISKDKKIIHHKAIIFFSDFDIKRLIVSEHLLIDGTFVFPYTYMQTIIIMYYDIITSKMIPGIFIITNNKTEEGYRDSFLYIKYYINKLIKNEKKNLKFKTFTTDFEKALFNAFNVIFNQNKDIKHVGCYFHYIQNNRKFLQKKGFTSKEFKDLYDTVLNMVKELPFKNIKKKDFMNYIYEKTKQYNNYLEEFYLYFEENWKPFFDNDTLKLNEISIKFRTNNSLEIFNKKLKQYFHYKTPIYMGLFIDILIEEVKDHEILIIELNKKPFKELANTKIKGLSSKKEIEPKERYYEEIFQEIVVSVDINENIKENTFIDIMNNDKILNNEIKRQNNKKVVNNESDSELSFENIFDVKEKVVYDPINKNYIGIKDNDSSNYKNRYSEDIKDKDKNIENIHSYDLDIITKSLIGMGNIDNTCYLNSSMQILLHYRNFIIEISSTKYSNKNIITNAFKNLILEFYKIQKNIINNKITEANEYFITPFEFREIFAKKHLMFTAGQQDAIEFIRILLEDLSSENNLNVKPFKYVEIDTFNKTKIQLSNEFNNLFKKKENSFIIDLFYIQQINSFKCKCGFTSYSFEKYLDIPLLIPYEKECDLKELLKYNLKSSTSLWEKPCESCKSICEHIKEIKFNILKDVLIISLQRINKFLNKKNLTLVNYEEILDMTEFCDETINDGSLRYVLFSIIYHYGNIYEGHYISVIKIGEFWYEFNDSIVNKINILNLKSDSACVFFYKRTVKDN